MVDTGLFFSGFFRVVCLLISLCLKVCSKYVLSYPERFLYGNHKEYIVNIPMSKNGF